MEISPDDLTISHRYKLLTGAIVPRPIAVVSTISEDGKHNVAPFSYFSIASHDPMALSVCITGTKPDRSAKDTLVNIKATGQFVVSIATERFASEMVRTSAPLAKGESEFVHAGLTAGTAKRVAAPRIGESPVCFECELLQVIPVGTANLVLGKVLHIFVEDGLLDSRLRMDFDKLSAIGRLAGTSYSRIRDRLQFADEGFFPSDSRGTINPEVFP
jgi:flavin reductase (DIM6/NTAB) family NADH-FMN oxidoreductase RutF